MWVVIYTFYAMAADFLSAYIPIYILNIPKSQILTAQGNTRIVFTLLYILTLTLLIMLTLVISNRTLHLSITEQLIFSFLSILCILTEQIQLISIITTYDITPHKTIHIQATVFILVLIIFFSTVFYVYTLGIEKDKNAKLNEEVLLTKLNTTQYEQLKTHISELRSLKHDVNHHLIAISGLISSHNYPEAINYINNISSELNTQHTLLSSGNIAFDCIISNKISSAKKHCIPITYSIHLTEIIPLDSLEICSLMGNLLDNAIEANLNINPNQNRFIDLSIKPYNDMLSIKLSNSSPGAYLISDSGDFISTKYDHPDKANHGLGINRIRDIIEKHNGIIRFTPNTTDFTVEILLPL